MPHLTDREILDRLVAFDTVSDRPNLPLVDWVADLLHRPGARVTRQPTEDGSRANLLVEMGPEAGPGRDGLVLCGHSDVVPATEPEWESDPFTLTERDGTWVARGAADMKGFLALAIGRVATVDPDRLVRPLALLITHDEEVGTIGACRFARAFDEPERLPRRTIVGEPTSLSVVRAHKGHVRVTVEVEGVAAHSAYPHLGENAIEPAADAVSALGSLRAALEAERPEGAEAFEPVPFVTLNVGRISGGVADNVVPDRCAIDVGLRPLPGVSSEELVDRVRAALSLPLRGMEWSLDVVNESPPMATGESDLHDWLAAQSGRQGTRAVSFATDAGWLSRIGLECVVWGPGAIEVAHKPNEFIPVDQFLRAGAILDRAIERWCGR